MKKLTIIHLAGCPYCANARRAFEELKSEKPEYAAVELEWIDENQQGELAAPYAKDYYYVPSIFLAGKKLYEARPGESYEECKDKVASALAASI